MKTGWKCPDCGRCYAPHVDQCGPCEPPVPVAPYQTQYTATAVKCWRCGGFVWQGVVHCCPSPNTTTKTAGGWG